jgi:hypothetical protein
MVILALLADTSETYRLGKGVTAVDCDTRLIALPRRRTPAYADGFVLIATAGPIGSNAGLSLRNQS